MASLSEKKKHFQNRRSFARLSIILTQFMDHGGCYLSKRPPRRTKSTAERDRTAVAVTSQTIDVASLSSFVADDAAGATSTFVGTTRDTFQGKRTLRLEYEAYAPMAVRAMQVTCLFVCGGLYKRRLAR